MKSLVGTSHHLPLPFVAALVFWGYFWGYLGIDAVSHFKRYPTIATLNNLTVKAVEAAKPTDKITRLYDGGGLYLEIKLSGQRGWRYKFRLNGRERRMSLGPATSITLAQAKELRREAESLIKAGIDPVEERRKAVVAEKAKQDAKLLTFSSLVWDWSKQWPLYLLPWSPRLGFTLVVIQ